MTIEITLAGETLAVPNAPEPLVNSAGRVYLETYGPKMEIAIDDKMRQGGIKKITRVYGLQEVEGQSVIGIDCNVKGRNNVYISLASRPELAALAENYKAISDAISAAQKAGHAKKDAERVKLAETLRAEMQVEIDRLLSLIPADHVRVHVKETGNFDGMPIYECEAAGVSGISFYNKAIVKHGTASATYPGAWAPFTKVVVASIPAAVLAEIRAAQEADKAAKQAKSEAAKAERAAKFAEAAATGQPVLLHSFMADCDGSVEDCSFDNINVYAQPDGSTAERRVHCH